MKAKRYLLIYNLAITFLFTLIGTLTAKSSLQLINSLIFLPLVFYFVLTLVKQLRANIAAKKSLTTEKLSKITSSKKQTTPEMALETDTPAVEGEEVTGVPEIDRRLFLKLIGSAGLSVFMLALFTKKAQAAFFGSVPGPGVIALKDIAGNKIDPAQHHPTAGFKIARLDDTSSPDFAYFGFVNKIGAWYLQRETLTGADTGQYLYSTGTSDFSTAWTNRANPTPTYATFDNAF